MDELHVMLMPLGSEDGFEFQVTARFRAANADEAIEVRDAVQELLPDAGVVCMCHVGLEPGDPVQA